MRFMYTCRDVAELLSLSLDHGLTPLQRLGTFPVRRLRPSPQPDALPCCRLAENTGRSGHDLLLSRLVRRGQGKDKKFNAWLKS